VRVGVAAKRIIWLVTDGAYQARTRGVTLR